MTRAIGQAALLHLQPVADHMRRHLAVADRLFMDEPRRRCSIAGVVKKSCFWAIASDDRS
ncbi:hypothetical protein ACRQ5Q_07425 [Bradyrhizobium sp. PMVTL-01]|uniref:hypothetical protein n=1 Tax=Bradyrhizobium sp. PMVTL-01 TaxID=3434999 RepID=UPI003F72B61D